MSRATLLAAMPGKKIVEYRHKVGYWSKGQEGRGNFVSLANFSLRLLKYVQAPQQRDSGFFCRSYPTD